MGGRINLPLAISNFFSYSSEGEAFAKHTKYAYTEYTGKHAKLTGGELDAA